MKLGSHFENPILTLFTTQGAVFLDQRTLLMNKYELEVPSNHADPSKPKQFSCQDVTWLKRGRTMVCLFEHNLVQVFKFMASVDPSVSENPKMTNFDLNQIHCKVL